MAEKVEDALQNEVNEMLGETPPGVEEELPIEEVPAEELPAEEVPAEKTLEEIPLVVEGELSAEEVPAVVIEEELGEETMDEMRTRIATLMNRVEELTGESTLEPSKEKVIEEEKPIEKEPPKEQVPELEIDVHNFLEGVTIDDLVDDEAKFNEVLSKVYTKAVETANKQVFENVLLAIPNIVLGHVNRSTVVGEMVKNFYTVNEDLLGVKKTVSAVANNLHAENPDWDLDKVFKEAGPKTREVLGMRKQAVKVKSGGKFDDPAFRKEGGGKPPAKRKDTSLQNEIDELLNL